MKALGKHVSDEAHILFGVGSDTRMGDKLSVTVITSIGANSDGAPDPDGSDAPSRETSPSGQSAPADQAPSASDSQVQEQPVAEQIESPPVSESEEAVEEEVAVDNIEPFISEDSSDAEEVMEEVPELTLEVHETEEPEPELEPESESELEEPEEKREEEEEAVPKEKTSVIASFIDRAKISRGIAAVAEDLSEPVEKAEEKSVPEPVVEQQADTEPEPEINPVAAAQRDLADQASLAFDDSKSGRFAKAEPTVRDGEDLDVPTFLRKKG